MNNLANLEIRIRILEDTKERLLILNKKIRKDSKAYKELNIFCVEIDKEIKTLSNEINEHATLNKKLSILKLEINTFEKLFDLKYRLGISTISELFETLVDDYYHYFLSEKLMKVKYLSLDKRVKKELNKTSFYICINNFTKIKVLYKLDDLIILENEEYLNTNKFKEYLSGRETFLISSKFNLEEIDLFFSIWENKNNL